MHVVIRDMCLWIACEVEKEKECYFVPGGTHFRKAPPRGELRDARRISLMQNQCLWISRLIEVPGSPHMSTLLLSHNRGYLAIHDGFFRYTKALTVLDLSETGLRVLPTDISEFVSLQYLDISATEIHVLPWGVMKLEKLQYCENLEVISYAGSPSYILFAQKMGLNPFPRLQVLELIGLPTLRSICRKTMLFPFLDEIRVCRCPMLNKLPLNTNTAKGRDLVIQGTIDWWIKLEWKDDSRNCVAS